jgi:cation transport regulator
MQYQTNCDLPECVRNYLPQHAQMLYLKAFNYAWEQYANVAYSLENQTPEAIAHKIAWSAVRNIYEKDEKSGTWKLRWNVKIQPL